MFMVLSLQYDPNDPTSQDSYCIYWVPDLMMVWFKTFEGISMQQKLYFKFKILSFPRFGTCSAILYGTG